MGIRTSSTLCCSPEQQSINLTTSIDISAMQVLDDEPLIHSLEDNPNTSLKSERMTIAFKPFSNIIHLSKQETQIWPCILELIPPISLERQSLDIVYVVELSSLLTPAWLNSIKKCVWYSLTQLNKFDRVSIVVFTHNAVKLCPLTTVCKENQSKIYNTFRNLEGSGGSNLIEGISMGLNVLSHRRMCNSIAGLVLFTRSQQNGNNINELLLNHGISTNFFVHAFGLGDHNTESISNLCNETEGNYYNIPHPLSLFPAFGSCLGELLSLYAEYIKVNIELIRSVIPISLEKIYLSQSYAISGKSLEICSILSVLPCSQVSHPCFHLKLLKAIVKYKIIATGEEIKEETIFEIQVFSHDSEYKLAETFGDTILCMFRYKFADLLYEILFEEFNKAIQQLREFSESISGLEDLGWVLQMKEELANYENLLRLGWNQALRSRMICSMQGFMNKSLFYVSDFQTDIQVEQQKICKEISEIMKNSIRAE
ncbi:hypothetical protein SteCoe_33306 [Stentor coeruleus]|uniref:VWFA domain-containing protein n=1 Tax=Stentor coeruleus TaxID=5963 RepID=A0A1R2AXG2_9CILI|nr:hypothetical protein SteCoe_33306 [Stentor coeruleus]